VSAARRRPPPSARRAQRSGRRNQGSDLAARVAVAIPALIVALVGIWISPSTFAILIAVAGVVMVHELYEMLRGARPVDLGGILAVVGLVIAGRFGTERQVLLVALAAVPVSFLLMGMRPPQGNAVGVMGTTLLGIYWIGLPLGCAALLRETPHGAAIITDILVGTFVGDTGAYIGGRLFGRRPLAPTISPNKTVEGLMVGFVAGVAGVWIAGWWQDWLSGTHALMLGIAVAAVAPIGDLFESAIKRAADTKDSGRVFGAHGGALDRLDAVLFSVVAGYFVWLAVQ
jgi:phosphatidate cytidylyltransferase